MIRKVFCTVLLVLLTAGMAFTETGQYGNLKQQYSGGRAGAGLVPLPGSDEDLIQKLQNVSDQKLLSGKSATSSGLTRKAEVIVTAEPGDGLVKLSWKTLNRVDKNIRYVLRYGTEHDNLDRSINVGVQPDFVLRGLSNYQPYYLQVVAMDSAETALYKSEEIQAIPLPFGSQGSRIEQSFARKPLTMLDKTEPEQFSRSLKQFGYDFFRNSAQLYQAVDSIPASDEYVVGPGDHLQLSIWGSLSAQLDLIVDRNGEVQIPKVGDVKVWGMSFPQAKETINKAIARYYRNYEMSLSMGRLRTIQVYVVGEVEAPGSYPISSMSTVINALAAAGGPTRNGSLRTVRVTRGNQVLDTADLYDMLLTGDRAKDLRLQNGDTIFVPVIGQVAAVAGEVRRPAIYELKGNQTVQELLDMAGGVTASGYTGRIQLERLSDNNARVMQDLVSGPDDLKQLLASVTVRDRDMLKVFPVQAATRQIVTLLGNVVRPGEYQFKPGMRLTDLITGTDKLLSETFLDSVTITRLSPPEFRKELVTVSLRRALAGSEADNISLQEQDSIKVFSRWEMEEKPNVAINGAVVNPGVYEYREGMTVRDLVTFGGSPRRNAFLGEAELSRITVKGDQAIPKRIELNLGQALAGDKEHNLLLQPDDVLIVRGVSDWKDSSDVFVTLNGEVRFPGVYTVARGEKLSSVIARAGGYTNEAYLYATKFTRRSVREEQQRRMDEIITRTEREITQKQAALSSTASNQQELEATTAALDSLQRSLRQMKMLKAEGRIVIRLAQLDDLKKSDYDLELEGGDEITIPAMSSVVHVLGQVYNQTSFVYLQNQSNVGNYLHKAGGPTRDAEESDIYIIKADGSVKSRQQSSFGIQWDEHTRSWSFGGFMSAQLMPGDTLVVPQKIERIAWMREIKDITQILANVAMTAGTVLLGLR